MSLARYFRSHGFIQSMVETCAECGEWGLVNSLLRLTLASYLWCYTKTGPKLDQDVGQKKHILELLGPRTIVVSRNRVEYNQRGILHRAHGPALVYWADNPDWRRRELVAEWYDRGKLLDTYDESPTIPLVYPRHMKLPVGVKRISNWKRCFAYLHEQSEIAKYYLDIEQYVSYSARDGVEVLDSDSEEYEKEKRIVVETFYFNAYNALDEVAKKMKEKRRAVLQEPPQKKKTKRKLVKRSDSEDSDE